jgi:hypothetical protein
LLINYQHFFQYSLIFKNFFVYYITRYLINVNNKQNNKIKLNL